MNKNIKIRATHRGISEEKLTDNTTSPAHVSKVICMETHDMMDLAAVKETGKSEVIKEKHYGIIW